MTKITTLVEDKFSLSPEDATNRNIGLLRAAMELLYATYIVDEIQAQHRGEAIQAINRLSLAHCGVDLISEWERHG